MEKIAIIGYSCLLPDAKNPEEFWQNLIAQKDSTSPITTEELGIDPQTHYHPTKGKPDKYYSLKGTHIRDFKFDPKGYKLPPQLLDSLDNTSKWSLYAAKNALQHSGYLNNDTLLAHCGVILGTLSLPTKTSNQLLAPIYQQILNPAIRQLLQTEEFQLPAPSETSHHNAMISGMPAAIIAQALSLSSTHFCIDAACSSPQYAIRLASHYLWTHKADMMLAGGVSAADPLFLRMLFSGLQAYPEDNDISRPLDKTSRGLMTGEGTGMFVLKRYSDAVRDGDRIHATITGNGLSNDGKGKHLLSPNSKGQVLAFERAYAEAGINPKDIDYLECHATGTLLGDTTEFNSVETFFGNHQASPLVGSAKANVGHLLVGAGSVGLLKVILSMGKGVIPATINVGEPIGNETNVISPKKIVRSTTNWQKNGNIKRAAISAFGFGGTNAHMIVEEGGNQASHAEAPLEVAKIAVVGMDAYFGNCKNLDEFERSIYDGIQHFIPLPEKRWRGVEKETDLLKQYGLSEGKAPMGAYIQDFEFDMISSKIPPNELDKLNPQQLLLLKVAERALKDAEIQPGGKVAVIIAAETELSVHQLQQRWNLSWQVKEELPNLETSQLETILKDSIHHPVELGEFVSYISNIMASRISALWDFNAPTFTMTAGENSTFKALEVAQHLLTTGEAESVLVGAVDLAGGLENVLLRSQQTPMNTGTQTLSFDAKVHGVTVGEGAGAVVLQKYDPKATKKVYAVVDAIAFAKCSFIAFAQKHALGVADAGTIKQVSANAFAVAGIKPDAVNYLEVSASGISQADTAEIQGLVQAYPGSENRLSCAVGSVKSNIGHTFTASGIASFIKTSLCLYYRYIPGTPQWSGVKEQEQWHGSPFYVAPTSRPWLLSKHTTRRVAAINGIGADGSYAHLIVSEAEQQGERQSRYLQQMPLYLFPLAGDSKEELLTHLDALKSTVQNSTHLQNSASLSFTQFQQKNTAKYTLVILGRNHKELLREMESAAKGVTNAFEKGEPWQTPIGSYFTPKPLGKTGEIAYVYPAAINAYVGIAQNIGRLYPQVHDDAMITSLYTAVDDIEKFLYPRSLNKLSTRQLENLEKELLDNSLAMFETEICIARLLTTIIRDRFQAKPKFAFGYSLGETSMMFAQGVWSDFNEGIKKFHASPLFGDRVSGQKNALREYWKLPSFAESPADDFWGTYVLIAKPEQVREAIKNETRVYLTQISTPEEVVIAGEPGGCQRVIKALGCNAFAAPFNHLIHCEAMQSEYNEIVRVNNLPAQPVGDIAFYSSAEYTPVALEGNAIAQSIGKCLTTPLDFPRLVNQIYSQGARIFIEAGAGNVCSRWIDKILENQDHVTVSLNRRGTDDHSSIVRALAKLTSHRVAVDLSSLYNCETPTTKKTSYKTITLGGNSITAAILTEENKKLFQDVFKKQQVKTVIPQSPTKPLIPTIEVINSPEITSQKTNNSDIFSTTKKQEQKLEKVTMKHDINNSYAAKEELQFCELDVKQHQTPQLISQSSQSHSLSTTLHFQKLSQNNSRVHKTHATFLQSRQEFSHSISEIIQLQIACAENLLNE
jgi:PfaB family protein